MPNTKSAVRRVRRVKKQTFVNRLRKSKYKAAIKHMEELIKTGKKDKIKRKKWETGRDTEKKGKEGTGKKETKKKRWKKNET